MRLARRSGPARKYPRSAIAETGMNDARPPTPRLWVVRAEGSVGLDFDGGQMPPPWIRRYVGEAYRSPAHPFFLGENSSSHVA